MLNITLTLGAYSTLREYYDDQGIYIFWYHHNKILGLAMLTVNAVILLAGHSDFWEFTKDTSGIKVNRTMAKRNISPT